MGDFNISWKKKTSHAEAGFANNSKDPGKETYRGISIVNNPDWEGWPIIHGVIARLGFTSTVDRPDLWKIIDAELAKVPGLSDMVDALYKRKYWDPINLDAEESQLICDTTFDIAVNQGTPFAKATYAKATKGL